MHVGLYQWDCCCAIETDSQATKHKIQAVNTFVICGYSKAVHRVGSRDGNSSLRLGLESHLSRINKDLGLDLDS